MKEGLYCTSSATAVVSRTLYLMHLQVVYMLQGTSWVWINSGSVKNFVALVKNSSFLVRITDMTILIEKEFIYGSSKRPNPTDYYRK